MSVWEVFLAAIGACGTVCAIIFGYQAYKRNGKSDNRDEGKKDGVVLTELGYIKSGVDDIKRKQDTDKQRRQRSPARRYIELGCSGEP